MAEAKAPLQGNPTSDRILPGPGCNRHSRVCADASVLWMYRATPAVIVPTAIGCVFLRHGGIYQSDVDGKPKTRAGHRLPTDARFRVRERAGRITLSPIVLMSSGRLFLDRVGRHQSPSPLHRQAQNKRIAALSKRIYHRTVTSVLTGCLTPRDKRTLQPFDSRNESGEDLNQLILFDF